MHILAFINSYLDNFLYISLLGSKQKSSFIFEVLYRSAILEPSPDPISSTIFLFKYGITKLLIELKYTFL